MTTFFSNGKLLLTAEYLVLDGANALALPTKLGQSLKITRTDDSKIYWKSIDLKANIWFEDVFEIKDDKIFTFQYSNENTISVRLLQILNAIKDLSPNFLNNENGIQIETKLDFPRDWGLGTSSTLINNLAQWANVDPYLLLEKTFGGSGYDIACANASGPIIYKLKNNKPFVKLIDLNPPFKDYLYFIHLNKKKNSRDGISYYKKHRQNYKSAINEINNITNQINSCQSLLEFENLIDQHETIIGKVTNQTPIKKELFKDFNGSIKSLGAWGGDFILATSEINPTSYFQAKGYYTILSYSQLIK